jgi:hypothetical protein
MQTFEGVLLLLFLVAWRMKMREITKKGDLSE